MKINKYNPTIEILNEPKYFDEIFKLVCNIPVTKNFELRDCKLKAYELIKMNHTSLLEHFYFTFKITNVSRSFMAQLTRHRMGSFTCSSQHYQHYSDYEFSINKEWIENPFVVQTVKDCVDNYNLLRRAGCPKEEARQILPNGIHVNIIWTVNIRSLINFLNLRLCNRNCEEIKIFSNRLLKMLIKTNPIIFEHVGPDCFMGTCTQGKLKCEKVWEVKNE